MKTNFFDENVGEWLQVPRPYFCISPPKIAPLNTPEAPFLCCPKALVHLVVCESQESEGQRCKKATLMV